MPAARFFSVLNSGRKLSEQSKAREYTNLCLIQSIAIGGTEHYENTYKKFYYQSIGKPEIAERANKPLNPTDQFTINVVSSIFETMTRLQ